jgi:DNA-binding Lrp family transcriptional regulator
VPGRVLWTLAALVPDRTRENTHGYRLYPVPCGEGEDTEATQEILALNGVTEVYGAAGPYNVVAVARVKENDELARLVTNDLIRVKGITQTTTLIAFCQLSQYGLERMFGLGM